MKVLHVISGLSRQSGGPSRSSQGLVAALCKMGVDACIYSFDCAEPWVEGVCRLYEPLSEEALRKFDLVHIHGLWDWRLHKVIARCRKLKLPYVVAPRGMLEAWSLRQKWLKKRIARLMFQDRDIGGAAALHATALSEALQFARLGFRNKAIVSPNGVNLPQKEMKTRNRGEHERMKVLYVSRMHPKKGVLELVECWGRLKQMSNPQIQQWSCELVYTVAGSDEAAYEAKVKRRILELGMTYADQSNAQMSLLRGGGVDFAFTGPLDDEKKWDAYMRADLFVLPTYSENFGIVVAEALWSGLPVITTKGTPWSELEEFRCGWWIDVPSPTVGPSDWEALQDALLAAFRLADSHDQGKNSALFEMGQRGHRLVEQRYTWEAACKPLVRGYEEILGKNC